jgi:hypothetical protein
MILASLSKAEINVTKIGVSEGAYINYNLESVSITDIVIKHFPVAGYFNFTTHDKLKVVVESNDIDQLNQINITINHNSVSKSILNSMDNFGEFFIFYDWKYWESSLSTLNSDSGVEATWEGSDGDYSFFADSYIKYDVGSNEPSVNIAKDFTYDRTTGVLWHFEIDVETDFGNGTFQTDGIRLEKIGFEQGEEVPTTGEYRTHEFIKFQTITMTMGLLITFVYARLRKKINFRQLSNQDL